MKEIGFHRTEYGTYLALCRSLKLTRDPLRPGDWHLGFRFGGPFLYGGAADYWSLPDAYPGHVWVPRIEDWLELLHDRGHGTIHIGLTTAPGVYFAATWRYPTTLTEGGNVVANGPTREEALARLLMEVTKVEIDAL